MGNGGKEGRAQIARICNAHGDRGNTQLRTAPAQDKPHDKEGKQGGYQRGKNIDQAAGGEHRPEVCPHHRAEQHARKHHIKHDAHKNALGARRSNAACRQIVSAEHRQQNGRERCDYAGHR